MSGDESASELNFNDLTNVELDNFIVWGNGGWIWPWRNATQPSYKKLLYMEISGASKIWKWALKSTSKIQKKSNSSLNYLLKYNHSIFKRWKFLLPISVLRKTRLLAPQMRWRSDSEVENSYDGYVLFRSYYTTKYYFPKKSRKYIKGATIEGNVLTQE